MSHLFLFFGDSYFWYRCMSDLVTQHDVTLKQRDGTVHCARLPVIAGTSLRYFRTFWVVPAGHILQPQGSSMHRGLTQTGSACNALARPARNAEERFVLQKCCLLSLTWWARPWRTFKLLQSDSLSNLIRQAEVAEKKLSSKKGGLNKRDTAHVFTGTAQDPSSTAADSWEPPGTAWPCSSRWWSSPRSWRPRGSGWRFLQR